MSSRKNFRGFRFKLFLNIARLYLELNKYAHFRTIWYKLQFYWKISNDITWMTKGNWNTKIHKLRDLWCVETFFNFIWRSINTPAKSFIPQIFQNEIFKACSIDPILLLGRIGKQYHHLDLECWKTCWISSTINWTASTLNRELLGDRRWLRKY